MCSHNHSHTHSHSHDYNHGHNHNHQGEHHHHDDHHQSSYSMIKIYSSEITSFIMMIGGILMGRFGVWEHLGSNGGIIELIYYILALLPVGLPILRETFEMWEKGDIFNEFTLMILAAIGAFLLGDYPEGVAILLFYSFGEKLEDSASDKARGRITSLLGKLPDRVNVIKEDGKMVSIASEEVVAGDIFRVLPGERVALDATLENDEAVAFNTSAITGESLPATICYGEEVISGSIPVDREVRLKAVRPLSESTMSRIVKMIEEASSQKSHSETLLRRITRYYTPAVMIAALLIFFIPMAVSWFSGYEFSYKEWLYRSLVLLVCSCPCALVVSIPLSYFAAIGNASKFGLLFKGSRYLDLLRNVDTFLIDKTGTITTGEFRVDAVKSYKGFNDREIISLAASAEAATSHPLAKAIIEYARKNDIEFTPAKDTLTVPHGLIAKINGEELMIGSEKMMKNAEVTGDYSEVGATSVILAKNREIIGIITLSDTIKPEVKETFASLHHLGVRNITILSGDRKEAVGAVATAVGANGYEAELLPEDKHKLVEHFKKSGSTVAFIGDGINDAPSLAVADIGIAIGTGGTDVAMESADAVMVGNNLESLTRAFRLSRKIHRVVTENVSLAIGVKLLVMILGAFGIASLWAAVFADTGITVITILWTLLCLRSK